MPQGKLKANIPMKCMDHTPPPMAKAPGISHMALPDLVGVYAMRAAICSAMNDANTAVKTDNVTKNGS